jgi:hypothetical protein
MGAEVEGFRSRGAVSVADAMIAMVMAKCGKEMNLGRTMRGGEGEK